MSRSRPPDRPSGPFTRAQGREAGITDRQLRTRSYRRLFHDVHISSDVLVTPRVRAIAALLLFGGRGHLSHATAAKLYGAWIDDNPNVHVSVRHRAHRRMGRGIKSHLAHKTAEVVTHKGLRMSSPTQTFLELAKYLELVDLVVLGDSLVALGHVVPADLVAAADRWPGHGARLARRAARFVRTGVESPMESRLRMLIVLCGLPEPVINLTIVDDEGQQTMRLDLSWPDLRIAAEYEGRQHAKDPVQWRKDIARREVLDRLAWILLLITAEDIYNSPRVVVDRIVTAMRRRGAKPVVALDDEWVRHFPGRSRAA